MKRRTRWTIVGVGAVVIVGGIIAISATRGDAATSVRIEPVQRRNLVAKVTASGWIRPHSKVDVQSDIMGRVVELDVQEGDRVKQGQLLMRIDPAQYQAGVVRAQAAVSEALASEAQSRANQIQAKATLDRDQKIMATNSSLLSPKELQDAETAVKVNEALEQAASYRVAQAKASLQQAQDQLSKTVIRAPIDGVVTRLNIHKGEMAIIGTMNNPGSLLLTISDMAVMEAVVEVDETDVPQIKMGDSASISIDAFPRQHFTGVVTEVGHSAIRSPEEEAKSLQSSQAGGQAVDFEVVVRVNHPPPGLRPDLSATADIVTARRHDVLSVPIIALTVRQQKAEKKIPMEEPQAQAAQAQAGLNDQDQEGVFLLRDGKAHFVPVNVGIAGQQYFEVLSGLQAGDSVVAGPYEAIRELQEGKPIRPMPTATAGADSSAKQGDTP